MLKKSLVIAFAVTLMVSTAPMSWVSRDAGIAYAQKCTCKQGCKCDHCTGKSHECKCPKY